MSKIWISFLLVGCIVFTNGFQCPNLEGFWYNELGSEVFFTKNSNGVLEGEYRTAVEKEIGAAGNTYSEVRGVSAQKPFEGVIGFSAVFNDGKSATSWIGQCTTCKDETILKTTWLLKEISQNCEDEWKSTSINQDIFYRESVHAGPRKRDNTHVPYRSSINIESNEINIGSVSAFEDNSHKIDGKWYAYDGQILELLSSVVNMNINGTYDDSANSNQKRVVGTISRGDVFGFIVIQPESKEMSAVVGQFLVCKDREILETKWLRTTAQQSCTDESQDAAFKKITFTRIPPSARGTTEKSSTSSVFTNFSDSVSNFFLKLFGKN